MFKVEDKEIDDLLEELSQLYQKSQLLKQLERNKEKAYGYQKRSIQRNIRMTKRLIYYALKKTEKKVAVAKTVITFGTSNRIPVERVLFCLIESGDIKMEGEKIAFKR